MRRSLPLLLTTLLAACGGPDVAYTPAPQLLPHGIQKLALRPVANKTQQFGLEDKLALAVRDEFLRDGRYPLVPEEDADGLVWVTVTRYLLVVTQYDATLAPAAYKLRILVEVQFVDRRANQALWTEKNIESSLVYPSATLSGGLTEEQAREQIWSVLAPRIVKRVVDGFGAVTGTSSRRISGDAPSTEPAVKPEEPLKPVVPAPY
ncbi:MAG: LptE family protein [Elusimicrobia bacterium]|nr:LptE family protein [Elusimicrobiota bacterium]